MHLCWIEELKDGSFFVFSPNFVECFINFYLPSEKLLFSNSCSIVVFYRHLRIFFSKREQSCDDFDLLQIDHPDDSNRQKRRNLSNTTDDLLK